MLFLDTTILVGAADSHDECHRDGRQTLQAIATGKPGMAYTSDYVLDETLTILGKRRGVGPKKAVEFVRLVLSSPRVLLQVSDERDVADAVEKYSTVGGKLSFTDGMTLVMMARLDCKILCSHDTGFDTMRTIERQESA